MKHLDWFEKLMLIGTFTIMIIGIVALI
jgi:hypothetical protein